MAVPAHKENAMRRGSIIKVAAIGLVGLVGATAATVGGYRAVTGECLIGVCQSKLQPQAVVTPVAATSQTEESCAMGCDKANEVNVETVALVAETECHLKAGDTCEKLAASDCSEMAKDGDCDPATCDKPECCATMAQKESTEKTGG